MDFLSGIAAELEDDKTAPILIVAALLFVVIRTFGARHRERTRSSLVLLGLYFMLVPVAGVFRASESTLYPETRLAALVFATLALIGLSATVLFSVLLRSARVGVPRILQDVIVAGSFIIGVFMLASRAGLNLSGLIATSAVLTAVIGLAFQDTLGNVVGGLAIQLDNSVRLGDWIKVGDVVGHVTEIRWRYTAIETRNWETVILPNSLLVKQQVIVLGRRIGAASYWRRFVYFNVDFRYPPDDVIRVVTEALHGVTIERVAEQPPPECVVMDLAESYGHYAVRYWLTDLAVDDPTDSAVRTRVYFALRRAGIPLSMPAHAVFLTEDSAGRKAEKSRAEIDRRLHALSGIEIFSGLSGEERAELAEHLRYTPFSTSEVMARQGTVADFLYVIVSGEASVRVMVDGGSTREVARLRAGDFFGEMSLLTGEHRTATVVATSPVECYRLDKAAFQSLLAKRPEVAEHIADVLAQRRTELSAAREDLDNAAERERMRITKSDLLGRIQSFFALDDAGREK